jgi:hypothetical protein
MQREGCTLAYMFRLYPKEFSTSILKAVLVGSHFCEKPDHPVRDRRRFRKFFLMLQCRLSETSMDSPEFAFFPMCGMGMFCHVVERFVLVELS